MRHNVAGRKLGRKSSHRTAMFRNMAVSLITHGRIKTTLQKAKELRSFADRLVTLAKSDSLHTRRLAFDRLRSRDAVQKLFATLAPAFKDRNGGYTRILKLTGTRLGDAAQMAIIEYLRESLPQEAPQADAGKGKKKAAKTAEGAEVASKAKKEPKVKAEKPAKEAKAKKEPKAKAEKAPKAAAKTKKKASDKE